MIVKPGFRPESGHRESGVSFDEKGEVGAVTISGLMGGVRLGAYPISDGLKRAIADDLNQRGYNATPDWRAFGGVAGRLTSSSHQARRPLAGFGVALM